MKKIELFEKISNEAFLLLAIMLPPILGIRKWDFIWYYDILFLLIYLLVVIYCHSILFRLIKRLVCSF